MQNKNQDIPFFISISIHYSCIAVFELGHQSTVPTSAVLSEAVELVGEYSTDRSSRFVNGLLSRIAVELRPHELLVVADTEDHPQV